MNTLSNDWYVDHLLADVELIIDALEHHSDQSVAACPGWDTEQLVIHVGAVHRWARHCVLNGQPPTDPADKDKLRPGRDDVLADWFRNGALALADALRYLDPAAPKWHPMPGAQIAAFWPRRQAQETLIHRWDAQVAAGETTPIDPQQASDGIDEYCTVVIPRLVDRDRVELPSGSLHIHCTDVDGEWLVRSDDDGYHMIRAHQKGDAAIRGPASQILLALWGRTADRNQDSIEVVGDQSVAQAWLSLGGM